MTAPPQTTEAEKIANWCGHVALAKPEPYKDDDGDKVWLCDQCGEEIPWDEENYDCAQISCGACGFTICAECNGDMGAWMCEECGRAACEACANISEIKDTFTERRRGTLRCDDC